MRTPPQPHVGSARWRCSWSSRAAFSTWWRSAVEKSVIAGRDAEIAEEEARRGGKNSNSAPTTRNHALDRRPTKASMSQTPKVKAEEAMEAKGEAHVRQLAARCRVEARKCASGAGASSSLVLLALELE